MRRALTFVLLTLGVFNIALGLLLRFYAYPRLAVAPLDPGVSLVATGNATVFYPAMLEMRQNVPVTTTIRVRGKIDAPEVQINGSVAVWDIGQVTEDDTGALVDAQDQWVCVDRRTGMAVQPCSEEKTNGDTGIHATGLQLKFPFNTGRQDYAFYDAAARMALPMRYDGDETIDGLPVYRFVQTVPVMKIAEVKAPVSLVGGTGNRTVTAARMYEASRTYWVEPYTGQIVKARQMVHQFLRGPNGQNGQTLFDGTFNVANASVQASVDKAKSDSSKVQLLYDSGPRLLLIAGTGLLFTGVALLVSQRRRRRRLAARSFLTQEWTDEWDSEPPSYAVLSRQDTVAMERQAAPATLEHHR
ncbi:MAG TPA: DUF3068 domain-containing protein [Rugosimonospora sp.]|nr:DUF3068 domain-containing protein [Rugosimonospora sp.]